MTINYKIHFSHTSLHFFAYPTRALLWTHFGAPNTSLPDFLLNLTGLSIEKLTQIFHGVLGYLSIEGVQKRIQNNNILSTSELASNLGQILTFMSTYRILQAVTFPKNKCTLTHFSPALHSI